MLGNPRPRIEILIGMIGSGKSTYAQRRAADGAVIVAHDALSEMFHGRYTYHQHLRSLYRRAEERLAECILLAGLNVVIDRTHLTRESRVRWVDFAMSCGGMSIGAVTFPIEKPEVHAKRRFESDPRGRTYEDWFKVAEAHHWQATLEPFKPGDEGFNYALEHRATTGDSFVTYPRT